MPTLNKIINGVCAAIVCMMCAVEAKVVAKAATEEKLLNVAKKGTQYTVAQDFYQITWDVKCGGEIVKILLHNGIGWRSIVPEDGEVRSIPGITVTTGGKKFELSNDREAKYTLIRETPESAEFSFEGMLKTSSGEHAGISAKQTFSVYKEGVLFCDLEFRFEKAVEVSSANLGIVLSRESECRNRQPHTYSHFGLLLTFPEDKAAGEAFQKNVYKDPYVIFNLQDQRNGRPCVNFVDFFVEGKHAIGNGGRLIHRRHEVPHIENIVQWDLSGNGAVSVDAGTVYKNRWGMGLGKAKTSGKLVGARIYRWMGQKEDPQYPTDDTLKKIADYGCNILVLHDSWVKLHRQPSTYQPRYDEAELKRVVDNAHRFGMRVMAYFRPYPVLLEQGIFQKYFKQNYDGIYIDHGDAFEFAGYAKVLSERFSADSKFYKLDYEDFAAKQYFLYTKLLRETVGTDGIIIIHTGNPFHGFGQVLVDGYLSGEAQGGLMMSPGRYIEETLPSCAFSIVWTWHKDRAMERLTQKGTAYFAGIGGSPDIDWLDQKILAPAPEVVDSEAKTAVWPLWQMWGILPFPYTGTFHNFNNGKRLATSANPSIYAVVYKVDENFLLVTAAHLGYPSEAEDGKVVLDLDSKELGMTGRYDLVVMNAEDRKFTARQAGTVSDGRIDAGTFKAFEYKGFLLTKGNSPVSVRKLLGTTR